MKNYIKVLSLLTFCSISLISLSQYQINTLGTPQVIDFDGFTANGFEPTPTIDQLSSEEWEVLGLSDGDLFFGGTGTTGDYARGPSSGGVTTGGIYSFNVGVGNGASLGVQPVGNDFTDGSFTLRIENNTTGTIEDLELAYEVWVLNDQDRSNYFNFEHGSDNVSFIQEPSLDLISDEIAATTPAWEQNLRSITLTAVNIPVGGVYYLKWTSDDVSGSGSRDEFALDNISITGLNSGPTISATPNLLSGFLQTIGNPSAEQTFEVSAVNLTDDLLLTLTNVDYEISTTSGTGFGNTVTLTPTNGDISSTTIYVRLNGTTAANPSLGEVEINSLGATQESVNLEGEIQSFGSGVINTTPNELTGFVQTLGSPSPEQVFEVTASSLSDDLVLTVTAGEYEISDISGAGFGNSLTLIPINGEIPATDIYVRLNGAAVSNPENGAIELASIGTNNEQVLLEGEIVQASVPVLTVSPNQLSGFEQELGAPSAEQTFEVSGADLTDDINLSVTGDYEISLTTGTNFTNTLSIPHTGGIVGATTIYVRLNGVLVADPSTGEVTVSTPGAVSEVVTLDGIIIEGCNIDTSVDEVDNILTSNATGVSYQWVYCDNNYAYIPSANGSTFEPPADGSYAVILTQDAQCVDTSDCILIAGLNTQEHKLNTINAYPNPVSDKLTLEIGSGEVELIQVINATGAMILEENDVKTEEIQINTSKWESGVYFLNVRYKDFYKTIKIVK